MLKKFFVYFFLRECPAKEIRNPISVALFIFGCVSSFPFLKRDFSFFSLSGRYFFRFPKSVKISSRFLFTPSSLLMLVFEFLGSFPLFPSRNACQVHVLYFFCRSYIFTRTCIPIFFSLSTATNCRKTWWEQDVSPIPSPADKSRRQKKSHPREKLISALPPPTNPIYAKETEKTPPPPPPPVPEKR